MEWYGLFLLPPWPMPMASHSPFVFRSWLAYDPANANNANLLIYDELMTYDL